MRTLLILLKKEIIIFFGNKFLPKVAFIFPCVVVLIIPLVTTMDVKHVNVVVVSRDNSSLTREIITDMSAVSFFTVTTAATYAHALHEVKKGRADVILEIPHDFQQSVDGNVPNPSHISANGVNGLKGTLGSLYVSQSVMATIMAYKGVDMPGITYINYMYNPTLEYRNTMIPALMIMLLIMLCGFLPTLNLVSEKEKGTIEQMNVSPIKTTVFVLSKLIPYWIIGLIDISLAMLIAAFVYGLAPAGSLVAIYSATILFVFVVSGIGIIVANSSIKMSQSMFLMFFVVIIFVLMSGLLTPISSMPDWAQYITYGLPPRYFIDIMRSIYLKATPIADLWVQYLALAGFSILTNTLAAITYRKQH